MCSDVSDSKEDDGICEQMKSDLGQIRTYHTGELDALNLNLN